MVTFKRHLRESQAGAEVLEVLDNPSIGVVMLPECFTFSFGEEHRGDFERFREPEYIERLKEAVSHIEPNLKLTCKDFETDIKHEVFFEHTSTGIQIRRTPEILDI